MAPEYAIETENLQKHFGDVRAVDGVDLQVPAGSVLGLLGPNGAGKTTTVRILTTLLRPDSGSARVAGFDVVRDETKLRSHIGLAGQYAAVDENLTGQENLVMVGRLYHLPKAEAHKRADELLERFQLDEAASRYVRTYSGGMRRRLDLAAALVARPPVLFLDEPTTGLDPRSRMSLWETIEDRVAGGTTVLLTTQYLDEADRLADSAGGRRAPRRDARGRRRQAALDRRARVDGCIATHVRGPRRPRAAARSPRRCGGSTSSTWGSTTSRSGARRSTTSS